ncbi:putative short-chain dehydrogenase/reductase [Ilyonectria destructans]|nr:putative short-chain dehydrogenase/reductase [Ilyonectria destructans]
MEKTVMITGCSVGGLGFALAEAFQQAGYHVFATARDPTKVGSLRDRHGIEVLRLDVTATETIHSCVTAIRKKTNGRLDILVNNAGGAMFGPLVHASIEEAKTLYNVNVWGVLAVTQAFAPLLVDAQGAVLNISSMAGAVPLAWQGIYNSSKAAVTFLSETLKIELDPLGVRVVTAMVGAINTQIYAESDIMLSTDSWYKPIEEIIKKQAQGVMQEPNNESVEITARNIVQDTLRGRRGKIWRGGEAGTASVGSWLFPTRVVEWILHRQRGLSQLRRVRKTVQ